MKELLKKISGLLVCLSLVASLAACDGNDFEEGDKPVEPTETEELAEDVEVNSAETEESEETVEVSPTEKQEETKPEATKPTSDYENAYIRDMSNYDLYYMFDADTKKVVYFGTNDTYIENGTYTGDFATGVTINWSHGEWTEKFIHASGNKATLIDGNGFDWEYKTCDVAEAQKVLDELE